MKKTSLTVLIAIVLLQLYCLLQEGTKYYAEASGMYNFLGGLLLILIGLIVCIPKQSREIGQGLLIAGGFLMIIGFATCSGLR